MKVDNRVRWLAGQARGDVLDLGCGTGEASILCARQGMRTLGIDLAPALVDLANAARDEEPEAVRALLSFEVGDGLTSEVPDAVFHSVLLGDVIEAQADPDPLVAEAVRVLRPDGVLVLTTPLGYSARADQRTVFFVSSLIDLLGRHVSIETVDMVDGSFRVVARPGPMAWRDRVQLSADLQPAFEAALLQTQRSLVHERAVADTRAREQAYHTSYATWRLESMQRSRWWRLGKVLADLARQPSQAGGLPREVARALRPLPRPQKPAKEAADVAPPTPPVLPDGDGTSRTAVAGGPPEDGTDYFCEVDLPNAVELPAGPVARPELTAAVILDEFSAPAFTYEWNQVQPGPDDWREVLERSAPQLLFVESAWAGNGGRWTGMMSTPGRGSTHASWGPREPLCELVSWCREHGIPTVFWNKEDPPHFYRFLETARLFDQVFTVDADRIPLYQEILGHNRVGVLPFAAQPRIHHPVSVPGGRRHSVAFAGTYYTNKHRGRVSQMVAVLSPAREYGLHIFTRRANDPKLQFPSAYTDQVVGSLPYAHMLSAYKAYQVFLNVNSVTESPTMCARRVFELSACATPVISGPSRALEETFGDLIRVSDSPEDTSEALKDLLDDSALRARRGHLAMREVFARHTYGHRVDTVLDAVGLRREPPDRSVSVVVCTNRPDQISHALGQVARQKYRPLQLVLVLHGVDREPGAVEREARDAGVENVVVLRADTARSFGSCLNLGIEAADGRYIAKMDDDDLYGAEYLGDAMNAFSFTSAAVVGKGAHYVQLRGSGVTILRFAHQEHTGVDLVKGATLVVDGDLLRTYRFADLPAKVDTELLRRLRADGTSIYSADRFNFVAVRRSDPRTHTWKISDEELLRSGQIAFHGDPTPHVLI
ncbi:methyltransferase domain-containing protein [Actinopolymorpha sp. B17G11]|uniref:glycosyltransferase family protein n=1 Tax=Actinopolymorpha sp. B17G11 TaxID=3160861 RepID=UPI0032E4E4FC